MRVRIDMTAGNPLKKMLAFCAPMLAGSVMVQFSGLLDGLIIGRVAGVDAFAAIAAAAPVAFLATGFLTGFCNGFLIPIALAIGAGDRAAADRFSCAALIMTALMAILMAVPSAALSSRMIQLAGTPGDIAPGAQRYLRIVLVGMPVPLVFMTLSGILRAGGDTRTPFRFQMLAMLLHLALDVVLIVWLRWGVAGAACASLIAHGAACALCARRLFRERPEILRLARFGVRPDAAGRLLTLGAPIALTNLTASVGSIAFQFAINSLGSRAVAAVAAGDRLLSLAVMPAMMMGGVIEVFSGQNCGANRPDRIRSGAAQLYALIACYLVPTTLLLAVGSGRLLPLLIGGAAEVIAGLSGRYMLWCAISMPLQSANVILKNVLQGVGMPQKAVVASAYDLMARLLCALFGAARFGFSAICVTNPVAWALSALALTVTCRAVFARACREGFAPGAPKAPYREALFRRPGRFDPGAPKAPCG